jgi:RNA-directed DNA polymerase
LCAELDLRKPDFFCYWRLPLDLTFEEVVTAYLDCRKGKRKTIHALDFEFNLEKNLYELYQDLIHGWYQIGKSIAFVVEQPKIREIWAGTFRDRIVHHIIYNRLAPRFYPSFIRNSFACIPERGVLDGSGRLWSGMRSITGNWQESCYYLQGDVRNFFVSIDKEILYSMLTPKIHEPWLRALVSHVIFHDPRKTCVLKSNHSAFDRVPRHKSLMNAAANKGLPIGEQFVAIQDFLREKLKLELHPFKKRIAPIHQGIDFIGFIHKPYRRQIRVRTASKMISLVHQWKKSKRGLEQESLENLRNSMNSYFGISRWASTYRLRQHLGDEVSSLFIRPDKEYLKLILPKYFFRDRHNFELGNHSTGDQLLEALMCAASQPPQDLSIF